MTREEFSTFVEQTLQSVLQLAEEYSGASLPRVFGFRWLGHDLLRENIVEEIVGRVFVDEEHIYPCVDIGVGDLLEDGTPVIVASVAGYSPQPFGKNWHGNDGPFIHVVGQPFLDKIRGRSRKDGKLFGFIIPGMKDMKYR
jgi:hypothetical protein